MGFSDSVALIIHDKQTASVCVPFLASLSDVGSHFLKILHTNIDIFGSKYGLHMLDFHCALVPCFYRNYMQNLSLVLHYYYPSR